VLAVDRPGSVTKQTAISYLIWGMWLKLLIAPPSRNVHGDMEVVCAAHSCSRFDTRQALEAVDRLEQAKNFTGL